MKNSEKKVNLLIKYANSSKFTSRKFRKLLKYSNDKDALVRSNVAELLINFESEKSKKTLLEMATDEDDLVRIEAYDSLSVFKSIEVEKFLKKAILEETNDLARAYAIMSWADVSLRINNVHNVYFVNQIRKNPIIQKSEHCMLSCYYALYVFGKTESLKRILSLLKSKNYQVRSASINTLRSLLDCYNKEVICVELERLIVKEPTIAVKSNAEEVIKLIKQYDYN